MELINLLRFGSGGKLPVVLVLFSSRGGLCLFLYGIMVVLFCRACVWVGALRDTAAPARAAQQLASLKNVRKYS